MKTLRQYINIVEAAESSCPLATKDIELNTKNRDFTQDKYNYGPLNIDEPGDYWEDVADEWDTTVEAAKKSLCGNCVAFDISPRMEDCMPGSVSDDADGGRLGYCWMHHFKCHSLRTCHTWAKGGPIDEDEVSREWGERNQQDEPVKEAKCGCCGNEITNKGCGCDEDCPHCGGKGKVDEAGCGGSHKKKKAKEAVEDTAGKALEAALNELKALAGI